MKPLLSEAQRDRLELYCDEEGFMDRVERILFWLTFEPVTIPKSSPFIEFIISRRFSKKPCQVKKELEQLIRTLEKLSPQALGHISHSLPGEPTFSWYHNLLAASKKPYKKTQRRNPNRDYLVEQIRNVISDFGVNPSSYKNGELVKIIAIICETANASYDPQEIAKDVLKKIRG